METAALVLGIVGAITGTLSLGWNIASHFLTAGRVKVVLRGAWYDIGNYASVPTDSFDPSKSPIPGATAGVLVEITNIGRLPVTVTEAAVGIGPEVSYGELRQPRNPALPYRLDVGDIARWVFALTDVLEVVDLATQRSADVTLRARASVGAGKPQFSKDQIDPTKLRR